MKFFRREHSVDYARYRFSYGNFAVCESHDDVDAIYAQGYLPYSADLDEERAVFYMARSLRVDLQAFTFTKKRRHLQRQISGDAFTLTVADQEQMRHLTDREWRDRMHHWMSARFRQPYLAPERLDYILQSSVCNRMLRVTWQSRPFAEVLLGGGKQAVHYWFAFYDSEAPACDANGKWLIGTFLEWARSQNYRYAYLGTGYGDQAAYKFHGIHPVEFWTGSEWSNDRSALKSLLRRDA